MHFNKYGELAEHIVHQLQQLKPLFTKVVLITNSELSSIDKDRLDGLYDDFIQRENVGFDFAAWREGIKKIGWEELAEYDSVTLMNDTCFGPVYPLQPVYEKMEKSGADFWGITNHAAITYGMPGTNGPVPRHNQSYLGVFTRDVIRSLAFQKFWDEVRDFTDVTKVIQKYETQLTQVLERAGFKNAVFFDAAEHFTHNNLRKKANYSEFRPGMLLDNGVPFVKIKSFSHNIDNLYANNLLQQIRTQTKYDTRLIEDYFEQMFSPNISISIGSKLLQTATNAKLPEKIAVHIHAFYPDVLEKYLERMRQWDFTYDLFLTVDTANKKKTIQQVLGHHKITPKKIAVTGAKGRDVVPWLKISPDLQNYEVVGHFHTKKSATVDSYIGEKWQDELLAQLFDATVSTNILANFTASRKLGVVIPDMPNIFAYLGGTIFTNERKIRSIIESLWQRIGTHKNLDLKHQETYVMPYGTMFWYRPEALQKLDTLQLLDEEVPTEPLKDDFTVLHALERVIVYVAWDAGYQYRLAPSKEYTSRFFDNFAYNRTFISVFNAYGLKSALKKWTKQRALRLYKKSPKSVRKVAKKAYKAVR